MKAKRFFTKLSLLCLISPIAILAHATTSASPGSLQQVSTYAQPDSPLRISVIVPQWKISADGKWQMLELSFRLENVSGKPIRAYAIRLSDGGLKQKGGVLTFSNITTARGFIQPYQSGVDELGGAGYAVAPPNLLLAVDFVEFADGSTWGEDVFESASRLAGQRAGAKATLGRLREIQAKDGIESLIRTIDKEVEQITPPADQKEIWKEGFRTGTATIRERIRRAYKSGGGVAAEIDLKKPYDTATDN